MEKEKSQPERAKPLLAISLPGAVFKILQVERILEDLRIDVELRREVIAAQKACVMVDRLLKRLVRRGFLEVASKPELHEDLHAGVARFARLLKREFPDDWKEVQVEWKPPPAH